MVQVSVIVLTYNPDPVKLRQTLAAAAAQTEVTFEIIISDDGSARKDFTFLPDFMDSLGVKDYHLLEHRQNRGTVQSCLSAVKESRGDYVFLTSPGDLLYDPLVLRDLYAFAQKHNAGLCFGNAVFYAAENGIPRITREYGTPSQPELYAPGSSASQVKTCYFGGSWIIGASYFRSRALALSCLESIADAAVYMEDTPSTAFALAAGEQLGYCGRNIVWYEDGTGVSTSGNEKWDRLLKKDLELSFTKLKTRYPRDPHVDIAFRNVTEESRLKRIALNLLRHPLIMARLAIFRKAKKTAICCPTSDLERLGNMLATK